MSTKVIIVGGGIFGSITAHALSRAGADVTVIEAGMEHSGASAAGCVIRDSWITGLGDDGPKALRFLDETFGLTRRKFENGKGAMLDGYTVEPETMLWSEPLRGTVKRVRKGSADVLLPGGERERLEGTVIVAAGIWTASLVSGVPMRALVGDAITYSEAKTEAGAVTWAPYRQAVWFPRKDGTTWFGDGTAVQLDTYLTGNYTQKSMERGKRFGLSGAVRLKMGMRPYCGNARGLLRKQGDGLWVSTGGAKNGSALGALHAMTLLKELGYA